MISLVALITLAGPRETLLSVFANYRQQKTVIVRIVTEEPSSVGLRTVRTFRRTQSGAFDLIYSTGTDLKALPTEGGRRSNLYYDGKTLTRVGPSARDAFAFDPKSFTTAIDEIDDLLVMALIYSTLPDGEGVSYRWGRTARWKDQPVRNVIMGSGATELSLFLHAKEPRLVGYTGARDPDFHTQYLDQKFNTPLPATLGKAP